MVPHTTSAQLQTSSLQCHELPNLRLIRLLSPSMLSFSATLQINTALPLNTSSNLARQRTRIQTRKSPTASRSASNIPVRRCGLSVKTARSSAAAGWSGPSGRIPPRQNVSSANRSLAQLLTCLRLILVRRVIPHKRTLFWGLPAYPTSTPCPVPVPLIAALRWWVPRFDSHHLRPRFVSRGRDPNRQQVGNNPQRRRR